MAAQLSANPYRASRCNYIFFCLVAADGTFSAGPEFWTVDKTGLGTYKITHNLGTLNYAVVLTALDGDFKSVISVAGHTANDVTVTTFSQTNAADWAFHAVIFMRQ